ncbi:MAG: hypothetical protein AAGH74_17820, partial [Pseudomonadota bacterium]
WMAMSEGVHTLPSGQVISAGRVSTEHEDTVNVGLSGFSQAPAVFAQVSSEAGIQAVTHRLSNVDASGFSVRLQESEYADQWHVRETIDWIAVDYGVAGAVDVVDLNSVDHTGDTFQFSALTNGAIFADMQTMNGWDTAILRLDEVTNSSGTIVIQEEQTLDFETDHVPEQVAVLTVEEGQYDLVG